MAPPWEGLCPPRAADSGPASMCRRGLTSVLKSPKLTHFYPKLIYRHGLAGRAVEIVASKKGTQPPLPTQPPPEMDTCPQANVSIQEAYVSNPTQHWVMRDVVCNCNQQAASMPSLTHTNPTSKRLWQLRILLSPPSMTLFQVLILRAPLPADESFYQHTQTQSTDCQAHRGWVRFPWPHVRALTMDHPLSSPHSQKCWDQIGTHK